jgi:5'-nucleotidase
MVVSNLNVSTEPLLTSNAGAGLQPYTVLTVAGQKIGIVGAIHTEVVSKASPGVNVKVLDPVTSLKAAMVELRAAHPDCNITILVASLSADHLRAVAAAVPGLDLILFRENSDDVNPLVQMSRLPGPNNGEVLVATLPDVGGASDYGGSFAKLVVNFDANGALLSGATWKQMDLGVLGSEDPAVWASVKTDVAKVLQYNGVVVGQLTGQYGEESNNGAYPQLWCRAADCNLGRLYTDAMLYWCKDCDMVRQHARNKDANRRSPSLEHFFKMLWLI